MREPSNSPTVNSNTEQENTITLPTFASVPRCSGRTIRELIFLGEAFEAISKSSEFDPSSYEEAMADSDSSH